MIRKQLTITATILLLTTFAFGQTSTKKPTENKWTIGTILMSESNRQVENNFSPNFFNGIILKRHFNYFTTRLGIEYVNLIDKKDKSECCDQINSEGYNSEGMITLGVEKGITFKKYFKPYLALDLTGIKSHSDRTLSGGFGGIYERVNANTIGFGATTALGFEFKMTKALSFSLETRLRLIYAKTSKDIDNLSDNAESYKVSEPFQKVFNRISILTLNFNF